MTSPSTEAISAKYLDILEKELETDGPPFDKWERVQVLSAVHSAIEEGYDKGYEECRKLWKALREQLASERERNSWSMVVSPLQYELVQLRKQLIDEQDYAEARRNEIYGEWKRSTTQLRAQLDAAVEALEWAVEKFGRYEKLEAALAKIKS